jgi:hypothetical protein
MTASRETPKSNPRPMSDDERAQIMEFIALTPSQKLKLLVEMIESLRMFDRAAAGLRQEKP